MIVRAQPPGLDRTVKVADLVSTRMECIKGESVAPTRRCAGTPGNVHSKPAGFATWVRNSDHYAANYPRLHTDRCRRPNCRDDRRRQVGLLWQVGSFYCAIGSWIHNQRVGRVRAQVPRRRLAQVLVPDLQPSRVPTDRCRDRCWRPRSCTLRSTSWMHSRFRLPPGRAGTHRRGARPMPTI